MDPVNDTKVRFFSEQVRQKLGPNLHMLFLFGSRARGDSRLGSDYDFVLILDQRNEKIIDTIRDTEVEFLDKFDVPASSLVYTEQEWNDRKNLPIGVNIEREGIQL